MTEREALLKAVCDHPDDDTPRLVFADWLQEHGEDARAEFVRLQVRRASGAIPPGEWARAASREDALEGKYAKRWQAELPTGDPVRLEWAPFERGFVGELLTLSAEPEVVIPGTQQRVGTDLSVLDWERLYRSAPFVRVRFRFLSAWYAPLRRPEAARLKSVYLEECEFDEESLRVLMGWERSGGELLIRRNDFPLGYNEKLRSAFGARYRRTTSHDR